MNKQDILIVDDDQAQHEILGEHLDLAGFSTIHAYNSNEGLTVLKNRPVDLILLDINMPEVDGFETIEILRNDPHTSSIPVLFLTSLDRQYLKVKGLELGADDYVTKPFNSAELIARIKAILRRGGVNSAQQSALSGDIKEIGLGDLLQNISQSSRTGKIEFADMDGELIISGENLLSVRQGKTTGMEALLRLMLLEHGRFSVSYQDETHLPFEQSTPMIKALLNSVNEVDHIKMAVEETTGQENPFLELTATESDDTAIDSLQAIFPCRLFSLVAAMEAPLKKNVYNVLKAIHSKKIRCLDA